ncbi:MAG: transcriptional regulator [Candidatus Portnoybacteria bacterium CG06_land_8_20_14_3_00_39_12]|uniref:Transcriptional regulator n=3 Tax=Candidatus Portnoyibacteriota TaxID=1817913 RepID=A0A2M8KFJ3_9BACT|nr:MAG: transcriptional regulator [Parcubacteria group bacterium CG1_02_40_25]PIU75343.1 MAG: transcriptional regulator [Candidatus Portnoybacteria bacterium CG06_land_8_20_14_3_00_39_12]PIZ71139.1 MAG: transcriptional regulator [Candidatus Portnoybacteria bacterium CG_4_10_14_0_2_um_filter_39_11]PJE58674.1 MAG: transcriptional regulator [Candidatus Portnoybacteria bacterium CG10_big_fil_rev_8_21_14_0_10_40_22]
MEFINLKIQDQNIQQKILKNIQKVINSGQFILGQEVAQFEKNIAQCLNVKYAIGVASGTDALFLSLVALGIKQGDEVITTPFSFIATANTISRVGATPVFADINPANFNIDPEQIKTKITKKTKAIIPVHLFGQMADMDAIMALAKKHNLAVIEDACQAIGACSKTKKAGTIGSYGCFSFFPTKNLGAYGDAGLVVTNQKDIAEKIKVLRAHGAKKQYHHQILGFNSRLDEIQAAVLNVKLKYLDQWNEQRISHARYFTEHLQDIKQLIVPPAISDLSHIFHQYTIRAQKRNQLKKFLEKNKIPTMVYYPVPLHLQPMFKCLNYQRNDFPQTEKASREVSSLPIYPGLAQKDQDFIIKKIKEFYDSR